MGTFGFLFGVYLYKLINNFFISDFNLASALGLSSLILLIYFLAIILVIGIWYLMYYRRLYQWRLRYNPSLQNLMDIKFKVLPLRHVMDRYLALMDLPLTEPNRMLVLWSKMVVFGLRPSPTFRQMTFPRFHNVLELYRFLVDIPLFNQQRLTIIQAVLLERSIMRNELRT